MLRGPRVCAAPSIRTALALAAASALALSACGGPDERLPLLYGEWQGVRWDRGGVIQTKLASQATFTFTEPDAYTARLGQSEEAGTFALRGSKLYTTAAGGVEKVVGVPRLEADTLVFDMNRAGEAELLYLARR